MVRKREKMDGESMRFSPGEDSILRNYRELSSYLADTKFEDGTKRETSTLLLFVEDGQLKACLNDREEGATAWVSNNSLVGILEDLEAGLQDNTLGWRQSKGPRRK